ncbi:MAG: calcium/sodium antiporter [Pseudomonadales bacterium]|jgi:cation:H+ antiporter
MWFLILTLILGFIALVWSADKFLSGAASTANHLGVSKMLIGLTVVSVGTSAPEILVSTAASIEGKGLLAIGNAIGSNIANIGLVLGITAIIAPLPFSQTVLKAELPWLLGATFLALILMFDLYLSPIDGILLLSGLGLILWRLVRNQQHAGADVSESIKEELDELQHMPRGQAFFWLIAGLLVLLVSAEVLVWSATQIAEALGVSELIIGLTIVAVGTSLPELAATVGSAIKGHSDIAIGNVVGSNILNILAVLAIPGLIGGTEIDIVALWRDCGMMLALTLLLALFAYAIGSQAVITRFEGLVMLAGWVGYNLLLVNQAGAWTPGS